MGIGTTLAERLLRDGIPPSLLIDLLDPEGMRAALAGEVLPADVAAAQAPASAAPTAVQVS
jgi:hypothetical protein